MHSNADEGTVKVSKAPLSTTNILTGNTLIFQYDCNRIRNQLTRWKKVILFDELFGESQVHWIPRFWVTSHVHDNEKCTLNNGSSACERQTVAPRTGTWIIEARPRVLLSWL